MLITTLTLVSRRQCESSQQLLPLLVGFDAELNEGDDLGLGAAAAAGVRSRQEITIIVDISHPTRFNTTFIRTANQSIKQSIIVNTWHSECMRIECMRNRSGEYGGRESFESIKRG
jgi:hypothetical protein